MKTDYGATIDTTIQLKKRTAGPLAHSPIEDKVEDDYYSQGDQAGIDAILGIQGHKIQGTDFYSSARKMVSRIYFTVTDYLFGKVPNEPPWIRR